MSKPKHLATIGFLCEQERRGYFDVLKTLDAAGVEPVMTINLTPHYDWNQASRALERNPATIKGTADA